ncbi:MAG TPA: ABC transporter permease, partial [Phormidium sp.]
MSSTLSPKSNVSFESGGINQANSPGFFGEFVQETLALTRRLFIQLQRRPSTLIAGVIQPL